MLNSCIVVACHGFDLQGQQVEECPSPIASRTLESGYGGLRKRHCSEEAELWCKNISCHVYKKALASWEALYQAQGTLMWQWYGDEIFTKVSWIGYSLSLKLWHLPAFRSKWLLYMYKQTREHNMRGARSVVHTVKSSESFKKHY